MPGFHVSVAHNLTQEEAVRRMQNLLRDVKAEFADKIGDLREVWDGHIGTFRFSAMGMPVDGILTVNPEQVDIAGNLPFAAMFFRERIESLIRERAEALLA